MYYKMKEYILLPNNMDNLIKTLLFLLLLYNLLKTCKLAIKHILILFTGI